MEPVAGGTSPRVAALSRSALITGKPYLVPYGRGNNGLDLIRCGAFATPCGRCCRSRLLSAAALAQDDRYPQPRTRRSRVPSARQSEQMERRAGRVGSSADDAGRDPGGGRGLQELPRADVAGRGAARHFARELRRRSPPTSSPTSRSWTSSTRSPSSPRRSGTMSICSSPTSASPRAANCWPRMPRPSTRWRKPTASTATSSRRSGASRRNTATVAGERPVIRSTATLACVGRRQAYFKDEFLAALEILHRGDIKPDQLKGSWAGAFGSTQFMPTAFKRYAVDFDGDGRRDVVGSVPDVVGLDREPSAEGRLGRGADLGLRGRAAAGLQLHARRSGAQADHAGMGAARRRRAPAARRFRGRATAPRCSFRPARAGRRS